MVAQSGPPLSRRTGKRSRLARFRLARTPHSGSQRYFASVVLEDVKHANEVKRPRVSFSHFHDPTRKLLVISRSRDLGRFDEVVSVSFQLRENEITVTRPTVQGPDPEPFLVFQPCLSFEGECIFTLIGGPLKPWQF